MKKYLYIIPALLVLTLVLIIPLGMALSMSFKSEIGNGLFQFTGLKNYLTILQEPNFWRTLLNTFYFTFFSVFLHLVIGVAASLLLNKDFVKGRIIFRIIALLPYMFSAVVVASTWKWMMNSQFGVINDILVKIGVNSIPWLTNVRFSMPSIILANSWRGFPFIMIMSIAGLQAIPVEHYEASTIDGANNFQKFFFITLPQLKEILSVGIILDFIWVFKYFDLTKVMTNGGPAGSTEVLVTLVYKHAFEFFNIGYASALAVIVFIILLLLSSLYVKVIQKDQG